MPDDWGIDWAFFLADIPTRASTPGPDKLRIPQPSYGLDALPVDLLAALPEFANATPSLMANLAYRNLIRGNTLQLPTGEQVATILGVPALGANVLWSAGARTVAAPPKELKEFADKRDALYKKYTVDLNGRTPLWYYILREAEHYGVERSSKDGALGFGGQHLGPVGSYIVAETFIGIMLRDTGSFLNAETKFAPVLPCAQADKFTLSDLVRYALA